MPKKDDISKLFGIVLLQSEKLLRRVR